MRSTAVASGAERRDSGCGLAGDFPVFECEGLGVPASVAGVKLVVQVKLLPTPVQAAALEATLRACNEAATWVSEMAFEKDVKNNFALRKLTYDEVKARWNLGAQAAQHVIKKACDAYATLKASLKAGNLGRPGSKRYRRATGKPIAFRPDGAQPYDDRMLSWQIAERRISVWTTAGRIKDVAFTAAPEQLATLALYRRGESDLVCRDGMWFLNATCEGSPGPSSEWRSLAPTCGPPSRDWAMTPGWTSTGCRRASDDPARQPHRGHPARAGAPTPSAIRCPATGPGRGAWHFRAVRVQRGYHRWRRPDDQPVRLVRAPGTDVRATDQVRFRGETYDVDGNPQPLDDERGRPHHIEVRLRLVRG